MSTHAKTIEALRLARPYVENAAQRFYDGTNGHGIRKEADRVVAVIDAALAEAAPVAAAPAVPAQVVEALRNARDIILTDRQGLVGAHQVRGNRVDDAVAHGLVLVSDGVWIEPDAAGALRDYDRALDQIDTALTAPTPAKGQKS